MKSKDKLPNGIFLKVLCISAIVIASIVLVACTTKGGDSTITLDAPENLHFDYQSNTFKWDSVEDATGYVVSYGHNFITTNNTYAGVPQGGASGTQEFSVKAYNNSGQSDISKLEYTSHWTDKEINANLRIENDCLVWDEFNTIEGMTYVAHIYGDDVYYNEIGLMNGMEFDDYKHFSSGPTSVRIKAGTNGPIYESTINTGASPTFYYYDALITEPFEYNVSQLEAPKNLSLDKDGYLFWDAVDNAAWYKINIYKDDVQIPSTWDTKYHMTFMMDFPKYEVGFIIWTNTRTTASSVNSFMGSGSYNFRVSAVTNAIDYIEGVPTIFNDSEKSLPSDTYDIQFLDLPEIVIVADSSGYGWEATPGASYYVGIQRGDKGTYFSLFESSYTTFEQIQQNIEFAVLHNSIDAEGEVTIWINSVSLVFEYCDEDGIMYMYNDGYSERLVIDWL